MSEPDPQVSNTDTGNVVVDPDFTAGPFVTRRNPTEELSSLLGSLYLREKQDSSEEEHGSQEEVGNPVQDENTANANPDVVEAEPQGNVDEAQVEVEQDTGGDEEQVTQGQFNNLSRNVQALQEQLRNMERQFRDSVNSSLNRETNFRQYVDTTLGKLEEHFTSELAKLERSVVNCLLRRDEKWKKEMSRMRPTSTPISNRAGATPTDISHIVPISPSVSPVGASPYYSKPPVRLEFPTFGPNIETSDVLNFVEQCENFLEIRPLSNHELIGTLSSVLKGPALSWWKAAKAQVIDWMTFKNAFMAAFLPTDYMSEVEEKL